MALNLSPDWDAKACKKARQLHDKFTRNGIEPGDPVLVKRRVDGHDTWREGYELFDPNQTHSTSKGCTTLKPEQRPGWCLVVRAGQQGVPISRPISHVRRVS